MIRCPVCGKEYSYGRKLCHTCRDHVVSCGVVFSNEKRRSYGWNCMTASMYDDKFCLPEEEVFESYSVCELQEPNLYEWNCESSPKLRNVPVDDKKTNFVLVYE